MNHEERLTEVIWRAECGEHTGEELQTHLHLRTVAVPASHTHTLYTTMSASSVSSSSVLNVQYEHHSSQVSAT